MGRSAIQAKEMSLNDLANIRQVIGAIAVVISLTDVALRIRQNTNAVRSATAQSVHEHFASWYHLLGSAESLSQVVNAAPMFSPTNGNSRRFGYHFRMLFKTALTIGCGVACLGATAIAEDLYKFLNEIPIGGE